MKINLLYLLALVSILAVGCTKSQVPKTPSLGSLQGVYSGQLLAVHTNTPKNDTLTANVQLTLTSSFGYSVAGDTSTVQAGSHGSFLLNSGAVIQFFDATFPTSGTPTKIHLSGTYNYTFDGVYLDLTGTDASGATSYMYALQKH